MSLPKHIVIYNGNGNTDGSVPWDINSPYADGATVTVLGNTDELVKSGYMFTGWSSSPNGGRVFYKSGDQFIINSNITLYAQWTQVLITPPTWITAGGNLGTIPELEYYEFSLDAYDATGAGLIYYLVAGRLPLGLQIAPTGKIQGIPVSDTSVGTTNVEYKFTVRASNYNRQVADRTFSITITDVIPPTIVPKNLDLGTWFDGTLLDVHLQAEEATPNAVLTWTLVEGTLPLGVSLTSDGHLIGYLQSAIAAGPGSHPEWDEIPWDLSSAGLNEQLGWDFTKDIVSKNYTFTIEVNDGVKKDQSKYRLLVFPRQDLVVSNTASAEPTGGNIRADTTLLRSSVDFDNFSLTYVPFKASETSKHYPVILTTQNDLSPVRQSSYFAFQFKAIDFDQDVLKYSLPTLSHSSFDEDSIIGFDDSRFSQSDSSIPGSELLTTLTFIGYDPVNQYFVVDSTNGLIVGSLLKMGSGLGYGRTVYEILDQQTLVLSSPPDSPFQLISGSTVSVYNSLIVIDEDSGWITGKLPLQQFNKITYNFEVEAYKRDYPVYRARQTYQLTVLGDLNDLITWVTPSHLGEIENGSISHFNIQAVSANGRALQYKLSGQPYSRLPQGLQLNNDGLIYGKVSFEMFSLDNGATMIDGRIKTSFDSNYTFTVVAYDAGNIVSATGTFSIRVVRRNATPYENLYFKALPTRIQREKIQDILNNQDIFNPKDIYRPSDPYFGIAKDLKFLFMAGLEPSSIQKYIDAVSTNHHSKRLIFGDIKSAIALDSTFNIKYEVVYVEMIDTASTASGASAADSINLLETIKNPYYDSDGNAYYVATPNGYNNMRDSVLYYASPDGVLHERIKYANSGALPEWMTSNQVSQTGTVLPPLGLTHGVVLAYVKPFTSVKIAYKLSNFINPLNSLYGIAAQLGVTSISDITNIAELLGATLGITTETFDLNQIEFTVDRYQLDNIYSKNYNIATKKYLLSEETSFDRYQGGQNYRYVDRGLVDYALSVPFEEINKKHVSEIQGMGGMDGVLSFKDGDLLIFSKQEFYGSSAIFDPNNPSTWLIDYNQGWGDTIGIWDSDIYPWSLNNPDPWDDNLITPAEQWDQFGIIPGFKEYDVGVTHVLGEVVNGVTFPSSAVTGQLFSYIDPTAIIKTEVIYSYDSSVELWRVCNQRAGIWRVNITDTYVTLSLAYGMNIYDRVTVRNGLTYSGVTLFLDPYTSEGQSVPSYRELPRRLNTKQTTFDGNGTKFMSNRDKPVVPEEGSTYIKFTKQNLFN